MNKPVTKGHILDDSADTRYLERSTSYKQKVERGLPGAGGGGDGHLFHGDTVSVLQDESELKHSCPEMDGGEDFPAA